MNIIDNGRLEVGDVVQHFKRELLPPERMGSSEYLYSIQALAYDANSGEELIVYKALYNPYSVYVRPLKEFISTVDKVKYPSINQVYRFEKLAPNYDKPL